MVTLNNKEKFQLTDIVVSDLVQLHLSLTQCQTVEEAQLVENEFLKVASFSRGLINLFTKSDEVEDKWQKGLYNAVCMRIENVRALSKSDLEDTPEKQDFLAKLDQTLVELANLKDKLEPNLVEIE